MGQSPPRRRWLRFSLRGLLIVVTLVAVWLGWNVHVVRQGKAALAEYRGSGELTAHNELNPSGKKLSLVRELMGDTHMRLFILEDGAPESKKNRLKALFPEATVGPTYDAPY